MVESSTKISMKVRGIADTTVDVSSADKDNPKNREWDIINLQEDNFRHNLLFLQL